MDYEQMLKELEDSVGGGYWCSDIKELRVMDDEPVPLCFQEEPGVTRAHYSL